MAHSNAHEDLTTHVDRGVLTITMNRPAVKNALSLAMRQELERLCAAVDADDDIAVLVLTGAEDVFTAGADIKEILAHPEGLAATNPGAALRSVAKPTVAAVNGICITGGLELALSCDWIVASPEARFADTHALLGVLPRWGLSALLPAAVGTRRAKEMTLTGRVVTADEAVAIGLVSRIVPHDGFHEQVAEMARAVAAVPGGAARATLDLYDEGAGQSVAVALELERERIDTFQSDAGSLGNAG